MLVISGFVVVIVSGGSILVISLGLSFSAGSAYLSRDTFKPGNSRFDVWCYNRIQSLKCSGSNPIEIACGCLNECALTPVCKGTSAAATALSKMLHGASRFRGWDGTFYLDYGGGNFYDNKVVKYIF